MLKLSAFTTCALFALLTACTETPQTAQKKEPEKPPEPITGQSALYRMYQVARSWAPDCEVLKMNTIHLAEVPQVRGRAAAWEATFVSATRSQARSYTYSVIEGEGNLHQGVFAGLEQGWSGPRGITTPFIIAAVKTDTDKAFQTALEKGAEYDKKNPGKTISILLEKTNKHPNPAWRIIWGESVGTSNFSIYVDASTGLYLETMR
jgi:hypothetical protein